MTKGQRLSDPARPSLALLQPDSVQEWERGEIERISALVRAGNTDNDFDLVVDPERADIVVLLESCTFKTQHDLSRYRALPFTRQPWKLCCINYEDGPPGFLPGLYSSLEKFRFDPSLHLSWPHLRFPNELVETASPGAAPSADALLFSFSGACSHPLRKRLFESIPSTSRWHVREVRRWYNHNPGEKLGYVEEILGSLFVLCPRGIASYSHRMVETLALGRIPVIIADDWVPFSIAEQGYYVQISERDVERIPALLESAAADYSTMRRRANDVYRKYFAAGLRYSVALNHLVRFFHQNRARFSYEAADRRWRSRQFWRSNGWTLEQRVARRFRQLKERTRTGSMRTG